MASRRSWVRIPSAPPNPQKLSKNTGSFVTVARTVAQLEETGAENPFASVLSKIYWSIAAKTRWQWLGS